MLEEDLNVCGGHLRECSVLLMALRESFVNDLVAAIGRECWGGLGPFEMG